MSTASLVLGIVGTASGVLGAITGIFALRQSKRNEDWIQNKSLIGDRTDLIKAVHSAHTLANLTLNTIRRAEGSRRTLSAMAGRSGALGIMEQSAIRDTQAVNEIISALSAVAGDFEGFTPEQIARISTQVHAAVERISALKSHYDAEFQSDEATRDRFAQQRHFP